MPHSSDNNFSVLYSFEPNYLRQVKEDVTAHWSESEKPEEAPVWQAFATEVGAFFSKS